MQIETLILFMWNPCPTFTSVMPASDYMKSNYFTVSLCLLNLTCTSLTLFVSQYGHCHTSSIHRFYIEVESPPGVHGILFHTTSKLYETIELDIAWQHLYKLYKSVKDYHLSSESVAKYYMAVYMTKRAGNICPGKQAYHPGVSEWHTGFAELLVVICFLTTKWSKWSQRKNERMFLNINHQEWNIMLC